MTLWLPSHDPDRAYEDLYMVPRPSSDIEVKRLLSDTMLLLERGLYIDKGELLQLGRLTFMCYGANISGWEMAVKGRASLYIEMRILSFIWGS